MKRLRFCVFLISVICLSLTGCSREDSHITGADSDLLSGLAPSLSTVVMSTDYVILNGYRVQFNGRVFENDLTTFYYTVSGVGAVHNLSHFILEIPDCAPELNSSSPIGAKIGVDPLVNIYGAKWDQGLGIGDSRDYSFTFPGDVPLGVIRTVVKASTISDIGEIHGPCAGFEISGNIYVDADSNGVLDISGESGINNVTVTLECEDGYVQTALTGTDGYYSFLVGRGIDNMDNKVYTITVESETAATDFNEELVASFSPTGPTFLVITVNADMPGNDFGFDPNTKELTQAIVDGFIETDGEPLKFWIKEIRAAKNNGGGRVMYDAATLAGFIADIQGLFLPEQFQFTPGNEFEEVYAILQSHSKVALDNLVQELLVAELNHVSGRGLIGAASLQAVMLSWVESVIVDATPAITIQFSNSDSGPLMLGGDLNDSRVGDAMDFLTELNGSIGGGSGGGG